MPDPFPTTRWSVVLKARDRADSQAGDALETLCEAYWFPLYAFVRRYGRHAQDAADLVQGFFAELIDKRYIDAVTPESGRFRAFLLHKMKHHLHNESAKAAAQKRGGRAQHVSLDLSGAEHRYSQALSERRTPETEYEYHWALTVVEQAMKRLAADEEERGKHTEFELLRPWLTDGRGDAPHAQLAGELGISKTAVGSRIKRLRNRFGDYLRGEIADTVSDPGDPEEVNAELRYMLQFLKDRNEI